MPAEPARAQGEQGAEVEPVQAWAAVVVLAQPAEASGVEPADLAQLATAPAAQVQDLLEEGDPRVAVRAEVVVVRQEILQA